MGRGLQNPFQYCALFVQGNPPAASRTFSKSKKITRAAELQLLLLLFLLWTAPAPVVELPTPSVTDGEPKNKPISEAFFWGAVNEFTIRSNTPVQEHPLQTLLPKNVAPPPFPPQMVIPGTLPSAVAHQETVRPPTTRTRQARI